MNIKLLKEKLINAINNVFDEFDEEKDICGGKDIISSVVGDLEKINQKWLINFQNIIHGVEANIIFNKNNPNQSFFKWELEPTTMRIDEKSSEVLKYKIILNLPLSYFRNNHKLTLELEYWKYRPENVYAGDNEGMVRYDILLNDNSKICGNTDLKNPKQIIDGVEKVLYNSYNQNI